MRRVKVAVLVLLPVAPLRSDMLAGLLQLEGREAACFPTSSFREVDARTCVVVCFHVHRGEENCAVPMCVVRAGWTLASLHHVFFGLIFCGIMSRAQSQDKKTNRTEESTYRHRLECNAMYSRKILRRII